MTRKHSIFQRKHGKSWSFAVILAVFLGLACGGFFISSQPAFAADPTVATVTSGVYSVSAGGTATETITEVPSGISGATFLGNIVPGGGGQTWDTSNIHTPVVTGDTLISTSGDTFNTVTYLITVDAPPVITLLGDSVVNIHKGVPYTDAGAIALDSEDGDLTSSIATAGSDIIDTSSVGMHVVTYDVTDSVGNIATQVTRTVNVYTDSLTMTDFVSATYGDIVNLISTTTADGSPLVGKTINFSINGVPQGSATTDVNGVATLAVSLTHAVSTDAGTFSAPGAGIKAEFATEPEYIGSSGLANLSVAQMPITVSAVSDSKVYNGNTDSSGVPILSLGTLAGGDSLNFTQSFDTADVGAGKTLTATGVVSDGNSGNNYIVTLLTDTTGSITTCPVTVAANIQSRAYGDSDPALDYTTAGFIGTDTVISGSFVRDAGENIGAYAINENPSDLFTVGSNYNLVSVAPSNLTITSRPITVTADAQSKTYGDVDPALTYTITTGSLVGSDAFGGALDRGLGEDIGTYGIVQGSLVIGANYTLTFVNSLLTINPKDITVTPDVQGKIYGDSDPALTYTFSPALIVPDTFSGSLDRNVGEDVGDYAVTIGSLAVSPNYNLIIAPVNFTISSRPITVTAVSDIKIYDGTDSSVGVPTITLGALQFGDTATWTQTFSNSNAGASKILVPAGTVSDGNSGDNYEVTFVNDTTGLIAALPITITANTDSKVYDGNITSVVVPSLTLGLLAPGDTLNFTQSFDTADVGVGKILTPAGEVGDGNSGHNYAVTFVNDVTGVISTRPITVTANTLSKTYGDIDPALTYSITVGALAGSDAFTGVLSRSAGEDVGSYSINQNTLALSGNYALTYIGSNLDINVRSVTVTADSKSKIYGDSDPLLTYQITSGSLVGSDAFTGDLSRVAGEDVADYIINQNTLALNGNYSLSFVSDDLTITPKQVTVTADAKIKSHGNPDPVLTYTNSALVGSDAFSGSLVRAVGEEIGAYAITQGTLTAGGNYNINFTGANLTINPSGSGSWIPFSPSTPVTPPVTVTPPTDVEIIAENPQVLGVKIYGDGILLRTPSGKIYFTVNGGKRYVGSIQELKTLYRGKNMIQVDNELLEYPNALPYEDGVLLRAPDYKIYLIVGGKKQHIGDLQELRQYRGKRLYNVSSVIIGQYPDTNI